MKVLRSFLRMFFILPSSSCSTSSASVFGLGFLSLSFLSLFYTASFCSVRATSDLSLVCPFVRVSPVRFYHAISFDNCPSEFSASFFIYFLFSYFTRSKNKKRKILSTEYRAGAVLRGNVSPLLSYSDSEDGCISLFLGLRNRVTRDSTRATRYSAGSQGSDVRLADAQLLVVPRSMTVVQGSKLELFEYSTKCKDCAGVRRAADLLRAT